MKEITSEKHRPRRCDHSIHSMIVRLTGKNFHAFIIKNRRNNQGSWAHMSQRSVIPATPLPQTHPTRIHRKRRNKNNIGLSENAGGLRRTLTARRKTRIIHPQAVASSMTHPQWLIH